MKLLSILSVGLGIVCLLAMVIGFYMAIANAGRDQRLFFIYLFLCIGGALGMSAIAIVNIVKRKRRPVESTKGAQDDDY